MIELTEIDACINMQCGNMKAISVQQNDDETVTISTDCPTCDFSCGFPKKKKRVKTFVAKPPQILCEKSTGEP